MEEEGEGVQWRERERRFMRTYLAMAGLKNEQQSTSERENDLRETSFHISNDNAPSFLPSSLLFTHSSHFLLRSVTRSNDHSSGES